MGRQVAPQPERYCPSSRNWKRNLCVGLSLWQNYTSPSAGQWTQVPSSRKNSNTLEVAEGLIEGFLGILENATYQELGEFGFGTKSLKDDDFSEHKGESPNQLGERIFRTVERIRDSHSGENLIIVSHGAAIALLSKGPATKPAFGHQYLMHNAGITELSFDGLIAQSSFY